MRNLVTGEAGFLGSHLVDRLMLAGEEVICLITISQDVRPTLLLGSAIRVLS